jgi:hypothetical protein
MAMINWLDKISDKLLSKGLSLKSDYPILSKNKVFFNEMLRDLLEEYPDKRLQHIILSMSDYYEVRSIFCSILVSFDSTFLSSTSKSCICGTSVL